MNRRALLRLAAIVPLARVGANMAKPLTVKLEPNPAGAANVLVLRDYGIVARSTVLEWFGAQEDDLLERSIDVQQWEFLE